MTDAAQSGFAGLFQRALDAAMRRDLPAAAALFAEAIACDPSQATAHANLGAVHADLGNWAAALGAFDAALALRPDFALAHCNRGNALKNLGALAPALESLDAAIALAPGLPAAWLNRAEVLRKLGRLEAALADLNQALVLQPGFAEALSNRSIVLLGLNRTQDALASSDAAIALAPDAAANHCNRGVVLQELRQLNAARASLDRALALDPALPDAHYNRATVLLSLGQYADGWTDYEWRWQLPGFAGSSDRFVQPRWDGQPAADRQPPSNDQPPSDRQPRSTGQPPWSGAGDGADPPLASLLLHCEQGLGDTLQFCRYAPLAAARGFAVHLEVQPPLERLLQRLPGISSVTAQGQPLPPCQFQCPLLSLPFAFGTTLEDIPADIPYLAADPTQAADWRAKLGQATRLRVGLVWSGGFRPDQPELWPVNGRRNLPLAQLAPLARANVEFFSLQKGQPAEAELAGLVAAGWNGPRLIDCTASLHDFADTAALIDLLDLIIAVDTSTAHLAGALGKPVWLLDRFDSCWRWLADRSDSPWYPSMTLFRQERPGAWDEVVDRVTEKLVHLTA